MPWTNPLLNPITPFLSHYYSLDESSCARLDIGQSPLPLLPVGAPGNIAGVRNTALDLTGGVFLSQNLETIPPAPLFDMATGDDWAWSVWFNFQTLFTFTDLNILEHGQFSVPPDKLNMFLNVEDQFDSVNYRIGYGIRVLPGIGNDALEQPIPIDFPLGVTSNVVLAKEGDNIKLFKDAVLISTKALNGGIIRQSSDFKLGVSKQNGAVYTDWFSGWIDELSTVNGMKWGVAGVMTLQEFTTRIWNGGVGAFFDPEVTVSVTQNLGITDLVAGAIPKVSKQFCFAHTRIEVCAPIVETKIDRYNNMTVIIETCYEEPTGYYLNDEEIPFAIYLDREFYKEFFGREVKIQISEVGVPKIVEVYALSHSGFRIDRNKPDPGNKIRVVFKGLRPDVFDVTRHIIFYDNKTGTFETKAIGTIDALSGEGGGRLIQSARILTKQEIRGVTGVETEYLTENDLVILSELCIPLILESS